MPEQQKLSDLIIEAGPYAWDEHQQEPRPDISGQLCDAAALNELREELIAARQASEERGRFSVEAFAVPTECGITRLTCNRCAPWEAEYDEPVPLDELNRRAQEHAEVCG